MTFAVPQMLGAALLAPLLVLLAWAYERHQRRLALAKLGDSELVSRLTAAASPGRRAAKGGFVAMAAASLCVAAARPQVQGTKEVEIRGLDIVIALDVSTSMLVRDLPPPATDETRLDLARQLIAQLLDALPGDRVGPVVFAAAAAHFPLTEDHEVALQFFTDLGPADLPRGSDLAEALRVSQCLLRPDVGADAGCAATIGRRGNGGRPLSGEREVVERKKDGDEEGDEGELVEREQRGRVIVVVSDGEESGNEGDAGGQEAMREVRKARELGIATLFVGVGSAEGGRVYDIDDQGRRVREKRDDAGKPVVSKRQDQAMRALAAAGGDASRYLIAGDRPDPAAITSALERVSRGLATRKTKQKRDVFHPFVFAAVLLLAIEATISTRRRRRYPEARPA